MVPVPESGPNDSPTRDHDRAVVLVGYTLLGAAMNGFFPEAPVAFDRGRRTTVSTEFFLHCHRN
jgi:hypothetical protein